MRGHFNENPPERELHLSVALIVAITSYYEKMISPPPTPSYDEKVYTCGSIFEKMAISRLRKS